MYFKIIRQGAIESIIVTHSFVGLDDLIRLFCQGDFVVYDIFKLVLDVAFLVVFISFRKNMVLQYSLIKVSVIACIPTDSSLHK